MITSESNVLDIFPSEFFDLEKGVRWSLSREPQYRVTSTIELLNFVYSEPSRHYHNMSHIDVMVRWIDYFNISDNDKRRLILAAAFHDIVYIPGNTDNEEKSLLAFFECIGAKTAEDSAYISAYILSTKSHKPFDVPYCKEFIDLDLLPFSFEEDKYLEYVGSIRKEYSKYNDMEWLCGRRDFLEKLYRSRNGKIFYTLDGFNSNAKFNIESELGEIEVKLKSC